jgi:hypothetical protein
VLHLIPRVYTPVTGCWGEHRHLVCLCVYVNNVFRSLGPADLTYDSVSYPLNTSTIPTVTGTLYAQGAIKQNLVAVSFEPMASGSVVNGELTFGATDTTKYIGDISYS